MSLGYNRPLYLLPFDHRQSYVTGMFHFTSRLTADEHDIVADSKQVIHDGFRQALGNGVPKSRAGILIDEEFGAGILRETSMALPPLARQRHHRPATRDVLRRRTQPRASAFGVSGTDAGRDVLWHRRHRASRPDDTRGRCAPSPR